jgi:hypothetical protein
MKTNNGVSRGAAKSTGRGIVRKGFHSFNTPENIKGDREWAA